MTRQHSAPATCRRQGPSLRVGWSGVRPAGTVGKAKAPAASAARSNSSIGAILGRTFRKVNARHRGHPRGAPRRGDSEWGPHVIPGHFRWSTGVCQDFLQDGVVVLETGPWDSAAGTISCEQALVVLINKGGARLENEIPGKWG